MIFLCEVILFTKKKCSRWLDVFRSLKYIEKHWRDYTYDSRCPLVTDHIRVCDPKLSTISVILELLSKPWYWPQTTRQCSESFHAFTTLMGETSVDLHHGPSVVGNYGPQGCLKHFIIDLEHFNCIEINNVPLNLINHGNYAFSLKKVYCFLRFVLNWGQPPWIQCVLFVVCSESQGSGRWHWSRLLPCLWPKDFYLKLEEVEEG